MNRTIILQLDELDYDCIQEEFARRQANRLDGHANLPDGESNLAGAMVAEMVRDYRELSDLWSAERDKQ
jgi:hypothetical protein